MPVATIKDLAEVMIQILAPHYGYKPDDIEIAVIGTKPGEKLYEELMSDEETRRAVELKDYFAILPAFRGMYKDIDYNYTETVTTIVDNPYVSANEEKLSKEALAEFLIKHQLLSGEVSASQADRRYWPGDKESTQS